jgi:hypothetical protein
MLLRSEQDPAQCQQSDYRAEVAHIQLAVFLADQEFG